VRRRELINLLGGAVTAWPCAVHAQPKEMPVIGFLYGASADKSADYFTVFRNRLADMGYVEGQTVAIEYRNAEGIMIGCQGLPPNWFSAKCPRSWRLASRPSSQPRRQRQPFRRYSSRVLIPSPLASSAVSTDLAATSQASACFRRLWRPSRSRFCVRLCRRQGPREPEQPYP
jgi:hypothetical protein